MDKVIMPKLGIMLDGRVIKWMKDEGDMIDIGDPLFDIETGKTVHTVEADTSGVLIKILAEEGIEVPVGGTVAYIGQPGEEIPVDQKLEEKIQIVENESNGTAAVQRNNRRTIKKLVQLSGVRAVTGERMLESTQNIPQAYIFMDVNMTEIQSLRQDMIKPVYEKTGVKVTFTDIFAWVVSRALEKHDILNSCFKDNKIQIFEEINVGFAINTDNGLLVPVIREADKKNLSETAKERNILIEKINNMKHTEEDITGGTFTISNLGMIGVDRCISIVNPGESAILGIGKINNKPVECEGSFEVKPIVELSLSFDHRVIDGVPAAKFLGTIKSLLEDPPSQIREA